MSRPADTARPARLRLFPTLLAYGGPEFAVAALLVVYAFFPVYYTRVLGFDFALAGALILITRVFDVITDPMAGTISDRIPSRFGRRKTWIGLGAIVVAISAPAVFFAEAGIAPAEIALWTVLLYAGWSLMALPHRAWAVDLSPVYHERTRIASVREAFGLAGTLVALTILGLGADGGPEDMAYAFGILGIMVLVAVPLTTGVAIALVPDRPDTRKSGAGWRKGLRAIRQSRPLRRLSLAYFVNGLANGIPPTLFVFFVDAVIDRPGLTGLFILTYFIAGLAGIPIWTRVSKRMGKHRAWVVALVTASVFFIPAALLGPGDIAVYLAVCITTGLCLGADLFLPPAIQADVVDADTVASGEERAGLLFSALSMISKLALAVSGATALWVLGAFGFEDALGAQNAGRALLALAFLYAFVPSLLKIGAAALMWRFPLDEAAQMEIRKKLSAAA
ncbi:MAG: MFS transporter [Sphingomonadales bacterium]|nr:MFS transporter [Sphingomonadales bacterium]